jgi:hypothetical protein
LEYKIGDLIWKLSTCFTVLFKYVLKLPLNC